LRKFPGKKPGGKDATTHTGSGTTTPGSGTSYEGIDKNAKRVRQNENADRNGRDVLSSRVKMGEGQTDLSKDPNRPAAPKKKHLQYITPRSPIYRGASGKRAARRIKPRERGRVLRDRTLDSLPKRESDISETITT